MKIRVSLKENLVKQVRRIAADRGTTLAQLFRQYLEKLVAESDIADRKRRELETLKQSF